MAQTSAGGLVRLWRVHARAAVKPNGCGTAGRMNGRAVEEMIALQRDQRCRM
jgi:hypothetical protein